MSDNKNNSQQNDTKGDLETRLADAKATAKSLLNKRKAVVVSEENVVDVATTRSGVDIALWLIAILALISSTLISTYLPRYWAPATSSINQLIIIATLVILAVICLAFTHQGQAFKVLLKDAGIELRRVTWPTKNETFKYTWQVIVVMIIVGLIVWLLDNLFNYLLGFILH